MNIDKLKKEAAGEARGVKFVPLSESLKILMDRIGDDGSLVYAISMDEASGKWVVQIEGHISCKDPENHTKCKLAGMVVLPTMYDDPESASAAAMALGQAGGMDMGLHSHAIKDATGGFGDPSEGNNWFETPKSDAKTPDTN